MIWLAPLKAFGKLKPLKLLFKPPTYCDTLRGLGYDWKVDDDLHDCCEKFICAVYGKAKIDSVYKVRHLMLQSKCGGDIRFKSRSQVPWIWLDYHQKGLVATKPVFGVSDKMRLKPVSSATETS